MGQGVQPSLWGRLGELRAELRDRVLLVAGEEDEKYVEIVRRMAEALPEAVVEILPNAGHAVHREAPEAVARAILEAIGDLGGE
jgi:2-succinyl-6-hydroxy-2,4-cyclohexadiene-1-carboxylate synthase